LPTRHEMIEICKKKLKPKKSKKKEMEMRGIDPRTSRMLSERSTI
jgi:hypothetical protein